MGDHRAAGTWSPAGVAAVLGAFLVANSVFFAVIGFTGTWPGGVALAVLLVLAAVACIAWSLGYTAREREMT